MRIDGNKVRTLRERKMLTQPELAELAGVNVVTINRIERGAQKRRPMFRTVRSVAKALKVKPEELLEEESEEAGTAAVA